MTEQQQTNIFTSYNDGMKNFSEFLRKNRFGQTVSIGETLRMLSKSTESGVALYDIWSEGIHNLTDESFKICRKLADGEQTEAGALMKTYARIYENLADRMADAIRDTPFECFDALAKTVKNSAEFETNNDIIKSVIQPGIDMGILMMNMFTTSCNSMSDAI